MKIVTFEDIDESLMQGHECCFVHSGCNGDADVVILDINTIFDYEEKKLSLCKEKYTSVAVIDDPSDFDAFKNFGITAWIKRDDLSDLPNLLSDIQTRMGLQEYPIIIDTHCHLDNIKYEDDIEEVINSSIASGVGKFIIPGADINDLQKAIKLSELHENIFFAVGIHPYDIDNYQEDILEKYINHPKCVAVGECGLDYFRLPEGEIEKKENIALQKEIFTKQINLAKKYNKPLIIHIRDASNDSKQILLDNNASEVGGVLHCYNADEQLLSLSEQNFYFGIGGVVTFKNAKKLVNVLPKIPKDKLLLETDGPYLTPHPYRGQRNEPKYTNEVAQKIAEILGLEKEEIVTLTTKNATKLFNFS